MLKQITEKEALAEYTKGKDIKVLVPPTCFKEPEWEDYEATLLSRLLEGTVYLADEEEKEEAVPAESDPDPEPEPDPEEPKESETPTSKYAPKNLDNGKIAALHRAGWSNEKIADELHTTGVTIGNRIKKMKERGEFDL